MTRWISVRTVSFILFAANAGPALAQQNAPPADPCTADERREALRGIQSGVLGVAPREVRSLERAVQPGGELDGFRLSHGLVVLSGAGGVAVDNLNAQPPLPPLLIYAPSPSSSPSDWLDFDGEEGPYQLVGWAYFGPYSPGSSPPGLPCLGPGDWLVHEAGWHLLDGGMHLTPDALTEPDPVPDLPAGIHFWHPQVWDAHFWLGEDGVPDVAFENPRARQGGVHLPDGSFFRLVNGRKQPVTSGT